MRAVRVDWGRGFESVGGVMTPSWMLLRAAPRRLVLMPTGAVGAEKRLSASRFRRAIWQEAATTPALCRLAIEPISAPAASQRCVLLSQPTVRARSARCRER